MRRDESVREYVTRAHAAGDDRFNHTFGCGHDWDTARPLQCFAACATFGESVRAAGTEPRDHCCDADRLIHVPGDVAMCTVCGVWWIGETDHYGDMCVLLISAAAAAAAARAPMNLHELLDAMQRSADNMERI